MSRGTYYVPQISSKTLSYTYQILTDADIRATVKKCEYKNIMSGRWAIRKKYENAHQIIDSQIKNNVWECLTIIKVYKILQLRSPQWLYLKCKLGISKLDYNNIVD